MLKVFLKTKWFMKPRKQNQSAMYPINLAICSNTVVESVTEFHPIILNRTIFTNIQAQNQKICSFALKHYTLLKIFGW